MNSEISSIEWQEVRRNALIIDDETDFCQLMKFYLSKKNFDVSIADSISQGVVMLQKEQPYLIIVSLNMHKNIRTVLQDEINRIPGYSPNLFLISANRQEEEGPFIYTLKRGQHDRAG